jgi:hypothetical protein
MLIYGSPLSPKNIHISEGGIELFTDARLELDRALTHDTTLKNRYSKRFAERMNS